MLLATTLFFFLQFKIKEEKEEKREKRKQRENHNLWLEGNHAERTCRDLLPISFLFSAIVSFSEVNCRSVSCLISVSIVLRASYRYRSFNLSVFEVYR